MGQREIMDEQKLDDFLGQMLQDLGGAFSVPLVRIGDALGLYKTLHKDGPMTSGELAHATGLAERYLREWLSAQAASNYVAYDAVSGRFSLTQEQAAVLADEDSPVYMIAAFDCAASNVSNQPALEVAFKSGDGVGWGNQPNCLFCAVAKFFRPGYQHNLVKEWLPALDGIVDKLTSGARVADVGCGHGHSTVIMAEAFPNSEFTGYDFHDGSIAEAREHAKAHGLTNVAFEVGLAKEYPGEFEAPERRPIGSKFVGHDPARREAQPLQQPSHDLRWGFGVSFGLEEEVENFTFIVDGAPEPVAPASVYDGHLIEMPVVAGRRPLASGVGNDDGFEL